MESRTDRKSIALAISLSESHRYRETSPVSATATAAATERLKTSLVTKSNIVTLGTREFEWADRWDYFAPKVAISEDGCWLSAATDTVGYGVFCVGGNRNVKAHRYAYLALVGEIPSGLECDHICRVRRCVNPSHIELVTHSENVLRAHRHKATRTSATGLDL